VRSLHPTHPVAAWGRDAKAVVEGHELATTPCGKPSPYFRLLERDGKILLLGTDISSLTFFHTLEEMLEPELPVQPFTKATFALSTRLADGKVVTTNTRLYEPAISRRRNILKIVPYLRAAGSWREARVGIVSIVLLRATDVVAAARSMLANGQFCYD
jgi:aminoglycoside 3-N-acetyltransferase